MPGNSLHHLHERPLLGAGELAPCLLGHGLVRESLPHRGWRVGLHIGYLLQAGQNLRFQRHTAHHPIKNQPHGLGLFVVGVGVADQTNDLGLAVSETGTESGGDKQCPRHLTFLQQGLYGCLVVGLDPDTSRLVDPCQQRCRGSALVQVHHGQFDARVRRAASLANTAYRPAVDHDKEQRQQNKLNGRIAVLQKDTHILERNIKGVHRATPAAFFRSGAKRRSPGWAAGSPAR